MLDSVAPSLNYPSQIPKVPYKILILIVQFVWQLYAIVTRAAFLGEKRTWAKFQIDISKVGLYRDGQTNRRT